MPGPFQSALTYCHDRPVSPGIRVKVPLGSRKVVGIVTGHSEQANVEPGKLKPIETVLDSRPLLPEDILQLSTWMSRYYLHEFSSAFMLALPAALRKEQPAELPATEMVTLTVAGEAISHDQLQRAHKQQALLIQLQTQSPCPLSGLKEKGHSRATIQALEKKGLLSLTLVSNKEPVLPSGKKLEQALELNLEQQAALEQVSREGFHPFLLEGITGSGKTEVYLQAIEHCLKRGKRALVLVPEIGLTPQTVSRFQRRFADTIVVLHSDLSDKQRTEAWLTATLGQAAIVIGTRSAILTPLDNLGLIVIDEEHDISFKQQDTLRYQARDVALKRAQNLQIPIILGSATPSLETLNNAISGRFGHLLLTSRAQGQSLPNIECIDMRKQTQQHGLSERLLHRTREHLQNGNQVLLFLNRRGYAPSWFCQSCGWIADCVFCDAHLTYHRSQNANICHHCGHREAVKHQCPNCHSQTLTAMGSGTERAEESLSQLFTDVPIIRFDRDIASTRLKFEAQLKKTEQDGAAIIVGTQMLAKGHHFDRVTLVGIIDIDAGLFSADLRAKERMGQQLIQVSGRSGRGKRKGEVLIQTHYPDNPLFQPLLNHDYRAFANQMLSERRKTGLPPFGFVAVIRCDSAFADRAEKQLQVMAQYLVNTQKVRVLGPIPALLSRRAGKHRYMMIVQAAKRSQLHEALIPLHQHYPRQANQVSWHIDIDPADLA